MRWTQVCLFTLFSESLAAKLCFCEKPQKGLHLTVERVHEEVSGGRNAHHVRSYLRARSSKSILISVIYNFNGFQCDSDHDS